MSHQNDRVWHFGEKKISIPEEKGEIQTSTCQKKDLKIKTVYDLRSIAGNKISF